MPSERTGSSVSGAAQNAQPGWKARLDLAFDSGREKTILRRKHYGPLVVQRPFYPEGNTCHAYVIHPPGGVVGGDRLSLNVQCNDASSGLITTPGANRFYGSNGRKAVQVQTLKVSGACLEWLPCETIYFDHAVVSQCLRILLNDNSRFIGWDIACFGRLSGNHLFNRGSVSNRLEVHRNNAPILIDRLAVSNAADLDRISGMRGATVCATMVATVPDINGKDTLNLVRSCLPENNQFAATFVDGIIVLRYLGMNAEVARTVFIKVWQAIRPVTMAGKVATLPRIWST